MTINMIGSKISTPREILCEDKMNRRYFAIFPESGTDNLTAAETEDKPVFMFKYRKLKKSGFDHNDFILAAMKMHKAKVSVKEFSEAVARWGGAMATDKEFHETFHRRQKRRRR